jgi:hypothetical protein
VGANEKIQETKIFSEKNHQLWNWELISEIFDGPLQSPSLYECALRSGFLKKFLGFLSPSEQLFSEEPM